MTFQIQRVTKEKAKLRLGISGPSGAGKTYTALNLATHMGGRICLFDTEYHSAAKYAGRFTFDGALIENNYHPERYMEAIRAAEEAGYDIIILDSLSHAWNGPGGILELVSQETKRKGGNSYAAWDTITPIYRRLIQSILGSSAHVIVTLRAKQDYVQEKDQNGRTKITKVGMAPEIREGFSYEMDIEGLLDIDHNFIVGKTRCDDIDGKVFHKPGKELADILMHWLNDGAPAPERPATDGQGAATPVHAGGEQVAAGPSQAAATAPDPWANAPEWMGQARDLVTAQGIKFADIPTVTQYAERGKHVTVALARWADTIEGDPLEAFKKLLPEQVPA